RSCTQPDTAQTTRLYLPRSMARMVPAGPKFEGLAVNPLGDPCMGTPAISDGMIFILTPHYLFGIGRDGAAKGGSGFPRAGKNRSKQDAARTKKPNGVVHSRRCLAAARRAAAEVRGSHHGRFHYADRVRALPRAGCGGRRLADPTRGDHRGLVHQAPQVPG